jgi:Icc-related predicted phosphoesterase
MPLCFFVSDLHGHVARYQKLITAIIQERPTAVFFGGDLLPSKPICLLENHPPIKFFVREFLAPKFKGLKAQLAGMYPRVFLIMGNDDGRGEEEDIFEGMSEGVWEYIHGSRVQFDQFAIYGYSYVPPTPFLLKDWERYDVSRYLDPGCISPEEGWHTIEQPVNVTKYATIQNDLENLAGDSDLSESIFLFHTPPYQTNLDRAALDSKVVDHVSVDVHVGSIAVKRLIENRQPLLTLHGHVHESPRLTGSWKEQIGQTYSFTAAHDGPELALVRFDPKNLKDATRELL